MNEANVDIAAGEQAHDFLSLNIDLALQNGGHGSCAGRLNDLLAALHEQEYCLGDLVVVDGDNVVGIAVDKLNCYVAGSFHGNAVGNG